jgi:hypothetical protein
MYTICCTKITPQSFQWEQNMPVQLNLLSQCAHCQSPFQLLSLSALHAPSRSEISYFVELQCAALGIQKSDTIAKILGRLMSMPSNRTCTECKGAIQKNTYVEVALELLVLHLPCADVKINQKMKFCGQTMHLRGVVYYGSHHYTSRIIDTGGQVWFHEGMITGKDMCSQGSVTKLKPKDFTKCNSRKITLLVYTQP